MIDPRAGQSDRTSEQWDFLSWCRALVWSMVSFATSSLLRLLDNKPNTQMNAVFRMTSYTSRLVNVHDRLAALLHVRNPGVLRVHAGNSPRSRPPRDPRKPGAVCRSPPTGRRD